MSRRPLEPLRYEDTVAAAERVVARMPEGFRYTTPAAEAHCFYVASSDPRFPGLRPDKWQYECGCIVGEVLAELGLLTDQIASSALAIGALVDEGALNADTDATRFLALLQTWQDGGETWAAALTLARREIEATRAQRPAAAAGAQR